MKISFVGTGYVGLVSGVMMSHLGHEVICLDVDEDKIIKLKNKELPIYEKDLDLYINKYANSKNLQFLHGYGSEIADSDCLFITVGTPSQDNGDADLSGVFQAIEEATKHINSECIIVLKSTVPPGTCDKVSEFMKKKGKNIHIASNPEFLREGNAIKDFMEADRIVIGAESEYVFKIMRQVYKPLTDKQIPLVETNLCTSELIKYAANSFLANKIAFINEMADLCEIIGADVRKLSNAIGLDKRIGKDFLKAGPGFGGSCFPKDILALQKLSHKLDFDFLILDAIIEANSNRPSKIVKKISNALQGKISNKKLAVLGLTYKAGTDDLRSSPAIELIHLLNQEGAKINVYDPKGMDNAKKYFDNLDCTNLINDSIKLSDSINSAVENSDAVIIATEWPEFREMDLNLIKSIVKTPNIIDLRNIFETDFVESLGFKYCSIGRKSEKLEIENK